MITSAEASHSLIDQDRPCHVGTLTIISPPLRSTTSFACMRTRYPTPTYRGHLVPSPPLSPFIRIRHDTLDDRRGSSPAPSCPSTDPARHTGRPWGFFTAPSPSIRIWYPFADDREGLHTPSSHHHDKGRPSHVGTYGAKATQKPSTRDFHATGNRRTQVQKHSNAQHISLRGPPRHGRYKGQGLQNISDKGNTAKGTSEPR